MARYTQSRNDSGFSLDQLRNIAPSIFAEEPASKVSDRYGFVPTVAVVEEMNNRGLIPVFAGQTLSRNVDNRPFAKHLIRFRPQYAPTIANQSVPEVVLMNSHDGSSGFKLWAGIFRMVCCNGMIISDSIMGQISVSHRSNAAQIVGDRSVEFMGKIDHIEERVQRFMSSILTDQQQTLFAERAVQLRWGDNRPTGLQAQSLLIARRFEDAGNTAWSVLNRIQENVIKGGVNLNRPRRQSSTRMLRSVGDDARVNSRLWEIADELIEA